MRNIVLALLLVSPCAAAAESTPDAVASSLWKALSHAPGEAADEATLKALFHGDAVIFGSRYRDGTPRFSRTAASDFIKALAEVNPDGFYECEVARTVKAHDRFATVHSVVESRTDRAQAVSDFVGINSLQLYRQDDGWRIVSLYYHVGPDAHSVALDGGQTGKCLD